MAEAGGLENNTCNRKPAKSYDENFSVFNVFCVFISFVTILADLTTDLLVFAEYCKEKSTYFAAATLAVIVVPNIIVNVFSMRWFINENKTNWKLMLSHSTLGGLLERYIVFLHKSFSCVNLEIQETISRRNDLNLLHFLYIFTGTIPQILLQSYAVVTLEENYQTKVISLTASIASVVWGCATYFYSSITGYNQDFVWQSFLLKSSWHFSMLVARLSGILLFATIFGIWTLVPLGLHWFAMTFWIVTQNTTFCPNKIEETFYDVVMGFVHCFSYINLKDGHTRYKLLMFYTLMVSQNFGSLLLYVLITDMEQQRKPWSVVTTLNVIVGTVIGITAMVFYYRYYHSKGPITWKPSNNDAELNNKISQTNVSNNITSFTHVRSFKSLKTRHENFNNGVSAQQQPLPDLESADKKFLLDHWMSRSRTPASCDPIVNNSMDVSSIQFQSVENTPVSLNQQRTDSIKTSNVEKVICSPTEWALKMTSTENVERSIDELTRSNVNALKNAYSAEALHAAKITDKNSKLDYEFVINQDTEGSNKKSSSDSIDLDLDLSFSDINSSDINTYNENIVQKLCLSALKNIKVGNQDADIENIQKTALDILNEMYQKKGKNNLSTAQSIGSKRDLDTPTEILSVHDYENICAVNIAREAWGLRSWNGYTDIENWLHDGSVVRDRRRDTLTSESTEISSCVSQDLKNAIVLSAASFPKKSHTYSNVYVKERNNPEEYIDYADETFFAKPCLVDCKDANGLEPILEELDDLDMPIMKSNKLRINSESSLVATIDEIRKATANSSPRNTCSRREHIMDSPFSDSELKIALWKEPYQFNSSNIMKTMVEKENAINHFHGSKITSNKKKDRNVPRNIVDRNHVEIPNSSSDFILPPTRTRNTSVAQSKKINNQSNIQEVTPKRSDFLAPKVSNINKTNNKNRPRRKFSILRERFEPKSNSDEEALYQRDQYKSDAGTLSNDHKEASSSKQVSGPSKSKLR